MKINPPHPKPSIDLFTKIESLESEIRRLKHENAVLWRLARFAQYDTIEQIEAMLAKGE